MIPARLVRQTASGTKYVTIPPPSTASSNTPTLCFIPGYRSEFMSSRKSHLTYDIARRLGYGFMAWDHHPVDGSVQQWYEASCELLASTNQESSGATGDQSSSSIFYLISSSMGTWLSLLLARRFSQNVRGILGIGSGVDFTERWLQNEVPLDHRSDRGYVWKRPSQYDPSGFYAVPVASLLDSRPMLLMSNNNTNLPTLTNCPITLIHGGQDGDVPLSHAQELAQKLQECRNEVVLDIILDGDHRLSRPQDLQRIEERTIGMVAKGEPTPEMKP